VTTLKHNFVECIPDALNEGVLYVSIAHGTAVHRCCCGCGLEVVTPLTPTDWKLIFDGDTVSLYPSIGSWNFPCRSHYWIMRSRVEWAESWSEWRVAAAVGKDRELKERFYRSLEAETGEESKGTGSKRAVGFWKRFWKDW